MKIIGRLLLVLIPYVLQMAVLKTSFEAETQRFWFVAFPIIGLAVSSRFAFTLERTGWFYAIVGILYAIQLFFSIALLSWKQT